MGRDRGLRGRIGARPTAYWVGPSNPFIDPGKEAIFQTAQLRNRTASISSIIRSQGQNPRRVFEQIADDIATMESLGIPIPDVYTLVVQELATEQGDDNEED